MGKKETFLLWKWHSFKHILLMRKIVWSHTWYGFMRSKSVVLSRTFSLKKSCPGKCCNAMSRLFSTQIVFLSRDTKKKVQSHCAWIATCVHAFSSGKLHTQRSFLLRRNQRVAQVPISDVLIAGFAVIELSLGKRIKVRVNGEEKY